MKKRFQVHSRVNAFCALSLSLALVVSDAWLVAVRAQARPTEDLNHASPVQEQFARTHRLGPGDVIAVIVERHPDYSDKVTVSPGGSAVVPLVGPVDVAGLTTDEVQAKLKVLFSEYLRNSQVRVSLAAVGSQRISVLGDVTRPGVIVMTGPMTVLDALAEAGGVKDEGNPGNVTILRPVAGGGFQTQKVDAKRILDGRALQAENVAVQPGDTVIVHGGFRKWLSVLGALAAVGGLVAIVGRR